MADITANAYAWSSTEASNPPAGTTTIGAGLDDNLRAIEAGVATWLALLPHLGTENIALSASVASNALTIALKTKAVSDPSTTDKVRVGFRNVTAATGDYTRVDVTAATSLVISSGSTLGARSGVPFRIWIVGFNDGGTFRLGAINCVTSVAGAGAGSDVTKIYPLSAWGIASSTAEGGAGGADSAQVFYTGTAVTDKAYTVLGYMTWESGLTTAGTWDAAPTRIQLFGMGVKLPGQIIQVQRTDTGATSTGSTTIPNDDTIPQNTEGNEYMTQAITPSSTANVLRVSSQWVGSHGVAGASHLIAALFQDSTANALKAVSSVVASSDQMDTLCLFHQALAATTSATTFKVRAGADQAGTTEFNGSSSSRKFGGVMNSFLEAVELMG